MSRTEFIGNSSVLVLMGRAVRNGRGEKAVFSRIASWFARLSVSSKVATVVVAIATGVGAILGAINGSIDLYHNVIEERSATNPLELVNVSFTHIKQQPTNLTVTKDFSAKKFCKQEPRACTISAVDIKVTNPTDKPVFIKRADFEVNKVWTFIAPYDWDSRKCQYEFTAPTHNYDVKLPVEEVPYTVSYGLSQSIPPDDTDRFTITPHLKNSATYGRDYVFLMRISLVYGPDDSAATSNNVLYGQPRLGIGTFYSYHPGDCMKLRKGLDRSDVAELASNNAQAAKEVKSFKAPRNTSLDDLLDNVSTN